MTEEQTAALERLAKELHSKMEHLDPTLDPEWDQLTDHHKDFYRLCVEWVLLHREDCQKVMER